jgi:hypothetical protein
MRRTGPQNEPIQHILLHRHGAACLLHGKMDDGRTPLDVAIKIKRTETADLLRKHGGKTGEELKSEVNKLYRSYEEQN